MNGCLLELLLLLLLNAKALPRHISEPYGKKQSMHNYIES